MKRISFLLAVLLAVLLSGCAGGDGPVYPVPELLEPVEFRPDRTTADYTDIVSATYLDGSLVPEVEELAFPVDGVLASVELYAGKKVTAGDVLATLDLESVQEEIDALKEETSFLREQSAYRAEQAFLSQEIAKEELAQLEETSGTPEADLRLKKLEIEELAAKDKQSAEELELTLRQKSSRIDLLNTQLLSGRLTAPFDGQVLAVGVNVHAGTAVSAYTAVGWLADTNSLLVETEFVGEGALSAAERICARIGEREYDLTPLPIDPSEYLAALSAGEELTTRYTVAEPDAAVSLGGYASVSIVSKTRQKVLSVPSNAVYRDSEGSYVYLIEDEKQLRRGVETGLTNGIQTEIRSGLQKGDVVFVKD